MPIKKLILTDCDGVLLDWYSKFEVWTGWESKNHSTDLANRYQKTICEVAQAVDTFNQSLYIRELPPHLDAIKYVRMMHEESGYTFRVITKVGDHPLTVKARYENLKDVFGSAIEELHCLKFEDSKWGKLKRFRSESEIWIDDHYENVMMGYELGYMTYFMTEFEAYRDVSAYIPKEIKVTHRWKHIHEVFKI